MPQLPLTTSRRRYAAGGTWSELAWVRNDRVVVLVLSGSEVSLAELARLVEGA